MAGILNAGKVIYEVDMDTAGILRGRREIEAALAGLGGNLGRIESSVNRTERSIASMERTLSSLGALLKVSSRLYQSSRSRIMPMPGQS